MTVRLRIALSCAAAIWLAGCASSSNNDPALADQLAYPDGDGPIDTGSYPNLNIAPHAAAPQLAPAEKAAKLAALRAAQQRQSPGAPSETPEAKRLRLKLKADGQGNTLKAIEAQ